MQTRVYKLYSAAAATTNSAAYITVQQTGVLRQIALAAGVSAIAAQARISWEVSFSSVGQQTTSDTLGPLATFEWNGAFTAAGTGSHAVNAAIGDVSIPVQSGDRIYLNILDASNVQQFANVSLYVDQA